MNLSFYIDDNQDAASDGASQNSLHVEGAKAKVQTAQVFGDEAMIRTVIKSNPEKGYELLFRKYHKTLCSHAVRYVYSKEIAEDIVSDIFVNLWRKRLFEHITTSYRDYLFQALRNTVYNYLKSEFAKKNESVSSFTSEFDIFQENNTPQKMLLFDELNKKIEQSVGGFSPQCQKVFLLSRFEGKKNREIASELNIKIKTVEAHMMKALSLLKAAMADYLKY